MALRSADGAPMVEVGSPVTDRPSWSRISVIAVIGFIVGVTWPRVVGVRLGPSLPEAAPALSAAAASGATEVPEKGLQIVVPAAAAEAGAIAAAPAPATSPPPPTAANSRSAQIEWEVGLVRDEPKTGKIIARLQRGTAVHIGPAKEGWYPVTYGSGYANEGWIYRGAIGR